MHCSIALSLVVAAVSSLVAAAPHTASPAVARRHLALASPAGLPRLMNKRNCSPSQMPSKIDMDVVHGIYQQVKKMTSDKKILEICLATCLTESYCNDLPCGDQESHGPFQQKGPGMGWGSVADTMNIPVTTKNFVNALMPHYNKNPGAAIHTLAQQTQLAEAGDRYQMSEAKAIDLANQMISKYGSLGGGDSGDDTPTSSSTKTTSTKTTVKSTSTKTTATSTKTGAINVGSNPNDSSAPVPTSTSTSSSSSGDSSDDGDDDDCDSSLPPCDKFYVPVKGDNCYKVSGKFGLTLSQFYKLNPNIDAQCQNLYAGQKYCVAAEDV